MKQTFIKLSFLTLSLFFWINPTRAQSHITGDGAGCRLLKTWGMEGTRVCPACAKIEKARDAAEKLARQQAYEKEKAQAAIDAAAKAKADEARWQQKQAAAAIEKKKASGQVLINGNGTPGRGTSSSSVSGSGSSSTTEDTETSRENTAVEETRQATPVRTYTPQKTSALDAVSNAAGVLGNYIVAQQAEKTRERQAAYAEKVALENEERARLAAETARENAEAERKKALRGSRYSFITALKSGKVPLSSEKLEVNQIYFFCYSYDYGTLDENTSVVKLSAVFPVAQRADDTWPFTSDILTDIATANNGIKAFLAGYYKTQDEAEESLKNFVSGMEDYSLRTGLINYKGRKSSSGTGNTDFWGNPVKPTTTAPAEKKTTVTVKKTNTAPQKKSTEPIEKKLAEPAKTEVDFWGNPVKKSAN